MSGSTCSFRRRPASQPLDTKSTSACVCVRRTPRRRNLLHLGRSSDHRKLAPSLQRRASALLALLQTASAGGPRASACRSIHTPVAGPTTNNPATFQPNHRWAQINRDCIRADCRSRERMTFSRTPALGSFARHTANIKPYRMSHQTERGLSNNLRGASLVHVDRRGDRRRLRTSSMPDVIDAPSLA